MKIIILFILVMIVMSLGLCGLLLMMEEMPKTTDNNWLFIIGIILFQILLLQPSVQFWLKFFDNYLK